MKRGMLYKLLTNQVRQRPRSSHGRRCSKPRTAFTLIELLTVIAIIGIIAAILIPVVGSVRDSARTSKCIGNLRALGLAMIVLLDENGQRAEIWRQGGGGSGGLMWANQLEDGGYLGSREILYCPARHPYEWDHPGFWPWNWRTYGFNMIPGEAGSEVGGNLFQINANAIEETSRHFLFADSFKIDNSSGSESDGQSQRYRIPSWAPNPNDGGIHTRHGGRANLVFLDGHVAGMDPRQLRRLGFMTYVNENNQNARVPLN